MWSKLVSGILLLSILIHNANSTSILSKPKATLTLFTIKKSAQITHLTSYKIQRTKPIKIILHGYRESSLSRDYMNIIEKYVFKDFNVIAVDYPTTETYIKTYQSLPKLAEYLAHFIKWLHAVNLIPLGNIHIIGYSLGGQIAGMTGHQVHSLTKKKIGRITALEPTRLGFESVLIDDANKLDPNDANFVDVVHTDTTLGLIESAGHVDYFPNAGNVLQPGCKYTAPNEIIPEIPPFDGWDKPISIDDLCSHKLARSFFAEAIQGDNFLATKCDSWLDFETNLCDANQKIVFGENTDPTARGKFFFATRAEWPYYITA